jgi:hypothetical protein
MSEPTEADREAAHAALANYWHSNNPAANADMARQVARFLAAARVEERERCAKIAESAFDRDPIDPSDAEADATWIAAKIRSGE